MGQPGDGKALAAARRVLNQVALSRSIVAGVAYQFANHIELLIAGKDKEALAGFPAILVFLFYFVNELANKVQHAVT